MKKVLIAIAITLLCCIALVACGKSDKPLEYTQLDDGSYAIRSEGGAAGEERIVIPSSYDGKAVTKISNFAFEYCTDVKTIEIPSTVTSIGDYAFYGCKSLTSIVIPDSVTEIGVGAFYGCESLTTVVLSNSLTEIPESAFMGCAGLLKVEIPDATTRVGENAFRNCTSLTEIVVGADNTNYMSIDGNLYSKDATVLVAYAAGKKAESFNVPSEVTKIGAGAFAGCVAVKEVVISDNVTELGREAFAGCTGLIEVDFSENITVISEYTFNGCIALKDLEFSNNIVKIEKYAFSNCTALSQITIPDSVTTLEMYVFNGCKGLKVVQIPTTTTSIGDNVFAGCISIKEAIVPSDAIPSIPKNVLQTVVINGGTTIKREALKNSYALISVVIPECITSIGTDAFLNCYKLVEIYNLSNNIEIKAGEKVVNGGVGQYAKAIHTSLDEESVLRNDGDYVFFNHDNADYLIGYNGIEEEITLPNDNEYAVYDFAFYQSSVKSLTIPSNISYIGACAFNSMKSLENIVVEGSPSAEDTSFEECPNVKNIKVPTTVISYMPKRSLETVEITSGSKINNDAFKDCSKLTSIKIAATVTSIGKRVFIGCTSLTAIVVDDNNTSFIVTENGTVVSKDNTTIYAYAAGKTDATYVVPEGVTTIKEGAFADCVNFTSIVIPEGVTTIEDKAFSGCTELVSVIIPFTVVEMGTEVFTDSEKLNIFYASTVVPTTWDVEWNKKERPVHLYSEAKPAQNGFYWHYNDKNEPVVW